MDYTINVLMIGSNTNVKGGMTTVVKSFLKRKFTLPIHLAFIASHSEKNHIYNIFYFIKSIVEILYHFLFKNPQIVHLHMSDKGSFVRKYLIFILSKIFNKKVLIHAHGGDFQSFYSRAPFYLKYCIRHILRKADKVIALGGNWEKILKEIEPSADITILMNSVAIPACEEYKSKPDEVFTILFLAVLNESKGILDLIQASAPIISKLAEQNKKLRFEIAGDGPMLEAAKKMVSFYGLENEYRFHGWVGQEEKLALFQRTDLFVLPSHFEGLPMSILEAISHGIPVISTQVGSIDEAVIEGVNGYLIEPGNIAALEDRLSLAIADPFYEDMRQASRKIAEHKFNEREYFHKVEELYFGLYCGHHLELN